MSRLIVKNIPTHMTEGQLKKHFESVGVVTDVKIVFKGTKNRKFCFLGYKTQEAALKAINQFNNTFVGLCKISVQPAKTLDDPELPRAWSRYSKTSSTYQQAHSEQPSTIKKVKTDPEKKPQKQTDDELESNPKFQEFMDLMKKQSTGTMAWTDNLNITSDNPKTRQKLLKEAQKKQKEEQKVIDVQNTKNLIDNIFQTANIKENNQTQGKVLDFKRLYVTNIPYNSSLEEVRAIFEKFGTVLNLKLPRGRGGTLTGYCFVTFALPEEAGRAYAELDNKIIMGRILHVKPAIEDDKPEVIEQQQQQQQIDAEKSSYKKIKKTAMLTRLEDPVNWNSIFLNPNSILESISKKYGVKKREILSSEGEDVAVRVAFAETQVIKETKEWLQSIGAKMDFLNQPRSQCERSKSTILVKNIQFKVNEQMLHEVFSRYGQVVKLYLSPNRSIAIVKFNDEGHAENAFKNLSYYKFQGCYFYLEWAPNEMINDGKAKQSQPIEKEDQDQANETLAKIVYLKNLNFSTTEQSLKLFFKDYNTTSVKIVKKDGLSMGYGFVEFATSQEAGKAIRQLQNKILDDHNIQLSQSKPKITLKSEQKQKPVEELIATNKLIIRNLPFESNLQEIRALVKNYGEVKKIRLPKKLNGQHRGFCFAEFVSLEETKNAFEALSSTHFYGRKLVIEYAKEEDIV